MENFPLILDFSVKSHRRNLADGVRVLDSGGRFDRTALYSLQTESLAACGGPSCSRIVNLLMNTDITLGADMPKTRFGKAKVACLLTVIGVFASISAIASVNPMVVPEADEEITQQILLIQDQEVNSREAQRLDRAGKADPGLTVCYRRCLCV